MKSNALLCLIISAVLLAGCDNNRPNQLSPTWVPPTSTIQPTNTSAQPTAQTVPPAPTELAPAPITEPPTEPPAALPTATQTPAESPTVMASPSVGAAPTEPPLPSPTPNSLFAPGQQDGTTLVAGGSQAYLIEGRRFEPFVLFVEPANELDIGLVAYTGNQSGQTTPEGIAPAVAADNALAGRPEILVLSPESDGLYTLVVHAVSGEGSFVARLFDLTTPAPGVVVQQPDMLSAGAEKLYGVASHGARPVIAVADPADQSDIALDILAEDGTLLTTANYSGPGGVETAYVPPLGTLNYTVKVREANNGASSFQILVIALE